jgi:glycosyltransferase involved in cell wall biosynthesis
MKLLLTNHELDVAKGGTQAFILDFAPALKARGHEVAVYAPRVGPLADELRGRGVPVMEEVHRVPFVPEVIHGQHHLPTMTAVGAFPGTPAIYYCHGFKPWEEQPPTHPRVRRHVCMAECMRDWLAGAAGRKPEEIATVPNSVKLERFQRVRDLGPQPRRALLFGNSSIPDENLIKLRQACEQLGLTLDLMGAAFGTTTDSPETLLPEYDVVFAVGRCALEALASGCAVIPFGPTGAIPMVLPDNFALHAAANFVVPDAAKPLTVDFLRETLEKFNRDQAAEVTRLVRSGFSLEQTCRQFEEIYGVVSAEWRNTGRPTVDEERSAMVAYLETLSARLGSTDQKYFELHEKGEETRLRLVRQRNKFEALEQKHGELREKYEAAKKKWAWVERRLPGVLRRWLLRGFK